MYIAWHRMKYIVWNDEWVSENRVKIFSFVFFSDSSTIFHLFESMLNYVCACCKMWRVNYQFVIDEKQYIFRILLHFGFMARENHWMKNIDAHSILVLCWTTAFLHCLNCLHSLAWQTHSFLVICEMNWWKKACKNWVSHFLLLWFLLL